MALNNPTALFSGPWTPTDASGAGLVLTVVHATQRIFGSILFLDFSITYPVTASALQATLGGVPFVLPGVPGDNYSLSGVEVSGVSPAGGTWIVGAGSTATLFIQGATSSNAQLSGKNIQASIYLPLT